MWNGLIVFSLLSTVGKYARHMLILLQGSSLMVYFLMNLLLICQFCALPNIEASIYSTRFYILFYIVASILSFFWGGGASDQPRKFDFTSVSLYALLIATLTLARTRRFS